MESVPVVERDSGNHDGLVECPFAPAFPGGACDSTIVPCSISPKDKANAKQPPTQLTKLLQPRLRGLTQYWDISAAVSRMQRGRRVHPGIAGRIVLVEIGACQMERWCCRSRRIRPRRASAQVVYKGKVHVEKRLCNTRNGCWYSLFEGRFPASPARMQQVSEEVRFRFLAPQLQCMGAVVGRSTCRPAPRCRKKMISRDRRAATQPETGQHIPSTIEYPHPWKCT